MPDTSPKVAAARCPRYPFIPRALGCQQVAELALYCVAAYLANRLPLSLVDGLTLQLGGIVVMLAVIRRSMPEALLVAVVGGLPTALAAGHPYGLIVFTAQAAFVHVALTRRRADITLYDAVFWLILGVPLILVFYAGFLRLDWMTVALVAAKQPTMWILETAAASVIHKLLLFGPDQTRSSFRMPVPLANVLAPVFVIFATLPLTAMVAVDAWLDGVHIRATINQDLQEAVNRLSLPARRAGAWPELHKQASARLKGLDSQPAVAMLDHAGNVVAETPRGWLSDRGQSRTLESDITMRHAHGDRLPIRQATDAYFTRSIPITQQPKAKPAGHFVIGLWAAPYVQPLRESQLAALALACLLALVAAFGSGELARRISALLHPLVRGLQALPDHIRTHEPIEWPSLEIVELEQIAAAGRRMEERLVEYVEALSASESRFRAIATNLPGGPGGSFQRVQDPEGGVHFTHLSAYFTDVLGLDREQILADASAMTSWTHPQDVPAVRSAFDRSAQRMEAVDVEFRFCCPSGTFHWVRILAQPRPGEAGAIVWDGITIDETARRETSDYLVHQTRFDALTGLFNRGAILHDLESSLADESTQRQLSIFYLDLDGIATANEDLGHRVGDAIIQEAATRIAEGAGENARVGRYGDDEFVVVSPETPDAKTAIDALERIRARFHSSICVAGEDRRISVTAGILLHPDRGIEAGEAVRRANVAMYQAKQSASDAWAFYTNEADEYLLTRNRIVRDLRKAIENDQLFLQYQPKVDPGSGRIEGFEALARWSDPTHGIVPPDRFIALAEEFGVIEDLGDWVVQRACADLAHWRRVAPTIAPSHVAVNVSARQLGSERLLHTLFETLRKYDLEPANLHLEVTESALYDPNSNLLHRLASAGFTVAIDDYGTGYSALMVLRDSPAKFAKIDRSFVDDLTENTFNEAIVSNTITLAHALGKKVVAEGVETQAQLDKLRNLGSDQVQGYYVARPMNAVDVLEWCATHRDFPYWQG